MKPGLLLLAGLVFLACGLLFTLQGAGVVQWPRESFMISQSAWIWRGIAVMLIGAGLVLAARRLNRR